MYAEALIYEGQRTITHLQIRIAARVDWIGMINRLAETNIL
jgi:hypothetical protein